MEKQLLSMMTQTVRFYAPVGKPDPYGFQQYATTPIEVKCHIESREQRIYDSTSDVNVGSGRCFTAGVFPWLNENYEMFVPDPSYTTGWRQVDIAAVTIRNDEKGPHHNVVYFGERGNRGTRTNA
jgi:hypothetical protein